MKLIIERLEIPKQAKCPHNENMCDKCGEEVGKDNLTAVRFLYCDKNDKFHPDLSPLVNLPYGEGYRQYFVCENCKDSC